MLGWKEYEMEVVRDRADNAIIICSIENVDPMGVHTGDSITVAPALTLTDKEYQRMRSAAIAVLREIGVETGGSNVQFAVDPKTGRMVVIEMNPRVSRSSALASKATGFPIAKVAARLAVGYTLDEIANDITGGATPASFEPTIDYVVTKIPRFAFEKFPGRSAILTTSMKSVGEVMAIGRSFAESLQKALRGLETGLTGLDRVRELENADPGRDRKRAARPTPDRLLVAAEALRQGFTVERINEIAGFDPWFLKRLEEIVHAEEEVRVSGLPSDARGMRRLKAMGFSDARLAQLSLRSAHVEREMSEAVATGGSGVVHSAMRAMTGGITEDEVRAHRLRLGVAGFQAHRQLRGGVRCRDALSLLDVRSAVVRRAGGRGGGLRAPQGHDPRRRAEPDRAGDRVRLLLLPRRLRARPRPQWQPGAGFEVIMVNCNPETVSTDPDTSDRLYFEPLTVEDVLEIVRREQEKGEFLGVIVQLGGQTPLKLAEELQERACRSWALRRTVSTLPRIVSGSLRWCSGSSSSSRQTALRGAATRRSGWPSRSAIRCFCGLPTCSAGGDGGGRRAPSSSSITSPPRSRCRAESPVLIDRYLRDAIEVDVDAICDGRTSSVCGVLQHIEEAGVHSGDSACSIPPLQPDAETWWEIERQTNELALALKVRGLMNVQFAVKDDEVYLIEVNPRASRTVPFVAKAIGAGCEDGCAGHGG